MTPRDAFLAAIIEAPDDDSPRLVYADWLDEQGQSERAEFIRVQVELANGPSGLRCSRITSIMDAGIDAELSPGQPVPKDGERIAICCLASMGSLGEKWFIAEGMVRLRESFGAIRLCDASKPVTWGEELCRREKELLWQHEQGWAREDMGDTILANPDQPYAVQSWAYQRGFVAEITLSCAALIEHRERLLRAVPLEKVTLIEARFGAVLSDETVFIHSAPGEQNSSATFPVQGGELWTIDLDGRLCRIVLRGRR